MTTERKHEMGIGGTCICPTCEEKFPHRRGVRCQDERCPHCGKKLLREGSRHHKLWLEKKNSREAAASE